MDKITINGLSEIIHVPAKEITDFLSENGISVAGADKPLDRATLELIKEKYRPKRRPRKKASISAVYNPQNSKSDQRKNAKRKVHEGSIPARSAAAKQKPEEKVSAAEVKKEEEKSEKTVAAANSVQKKKGIEPAGTAGKTTEEAGTKESAAKKASTKEEGKTKAGKKEPEKKENQPRFTGERVIIADDRPARAKSRRVSTRSADGEGRNGRNIQRGENLQKTYRRDRSGGGAAAADRGGASGGPGRQRASGGRGARTERPDRERAGGAYSGRKKKQSYGGKTRQQEQYINLEKKTGHHKRNATPVSPEEKKKDEIRQVVLPEIMTVRELAEKMRIQPSEIVKKLFLQGIMLTVNQEIDYEKAEEIALEFNCIAESEEKIDVIAELLKEEEEDPEKMVKRAPVVCVMGHVDHGKTSLLDAIRKTRVTEREAGGITQHIGAYAVQTGGRSITFLDTPGHEAFTAMRMRGANSTDIAILVVAADDGIMPQTIEAINHAKAAGTEIIVAINKIDKEGADIERVKKGLSEHELIPEDWGGGTICVPVSAKTGEGIEDLLEMVLLSADILELKANPDRNARGLVIEARLDRGRGVVATVLVQKGRLRVGQPVAAGSSYGKVRAMINDGGGRTEEAGPSTPVEILGLSSVPNAGEVFVACDSEREARSFAETFVSQDKERLLAETRARMSLDDIFSRIQEGNLKELNLIVKADVQGSVEAIKDSLIKLSNDEVLVKVIHGGAGAISESDVSLAGASSAIIIGFNVKPDATAKKIAEEERVDIRLYSVIYKAVEDIENALKGMLSPIMEERIIGHGEIRQIFKASGVGSIAGSYVIDGIVERNCRIRISRDGEQIYDGALVSLKRFKDDVKEVKAGFECGLVFEDFNDFDETDIFEAYKNVEVPR